MAEIQAIHPAQEKAKRVLCNKKWWMGFHTVFLFASWKRENNVFQVAFPVLWVGYSPWLSLAGTGELLGTTQA